MSIPVTTLVEYSLNGLGSERYPQSTIIKGSLWSVFISNGRLYIKEYGGNLFRLGEYYPSTFVLTHALDSGLFDSNKLWLFYVEDMKLKMMAIEPFTLYAPVISYEKEIATNVLNVSTYIKENDVVRLFVLYGTLPNRELKVLTYANITDPTPLTYTLDSWGPEKGTDLSVFVSDDKTEALTAYLEAASPFGVYAESFTVPIPLNLTAAQVGYSADVNVDWDVSLGSDNYLLQRDTNAAFPSPVDVYDGPNDSFTDTVPSSGTYYYRVKAQVTGMAIESFWSATASAIVAITYIEADFSATPLSGDANLTVNFTDLSYGSEAAVSWDWDFGDGSVHGTTQNPSHNYTKAGLFTVILTVNTGTRTDSKTETDYITVNMVTDLSGTPLSGDTPLAVTFSDLSLGEPTSWHWDFGDGDTTTAQNPSHTYLGAGLYTVSLDSTRGIFSDSVTYNNYINTNLVSDFIGVPLSGPVPLTVDFTDLSLGGPTSWNWNFGDGDTTTAQNPSHTYLSAGQHTVRLDTTKGSYTDSKTEVGYVEANVVSDFSATPTSGDATLAVTFTDLSLGGPTSWLWNFGDGDTTTIQNPTHTYLRAGLYTVSLQAVKGGLTDTKTEIDYITVNMATNFLGTPTAGNTPLSVAFTDLSLGEPTSWLWNFGDGDTTTAQNPIHVYTGVGLYTVRLDSTRGSFAGTKTSLNYINASSDVLTASFQAIPESGDADLVVRFIDTSIGSPTTWHWDFGDGHTSTLQNPTHTYTTAGNHIVTLTVIKA